MFAVPTLGRLATMLLTEHSPSGELRFSIASTPASDHSTGNPSLSSNDAEIIEVLGQYVPYGSRFLLRESLDIGYKTNGRPWELSCRKHLQLTGKHRNIVQDLPVGLLLGRGRHRQRLPGFFFPGPLCFQQHLLNELRRCNIYKKQETRIRGERGMTTQPATDVQSL